MYTCRDVIKAAYRRSGIIAAGVNLNATQANVGLERLKGMYENFVSGGMFGRLVDKYIDTGPYEAEENQRVFKTDPDLVVTLPTSVIDRENGGLRQPANFAPIVVVDPEAEGPVIHVYDRMAGNWLNVMALTLDVRAPLSSAYYDHIVNLLAVRLLDEAGQQIPPELSKAEGRGRLALASRYGEPRKTGVAEFM